MATSNDSQSGFRIGSLLGFPIYVDVTLLLIVGVLVLFNLRAGLDAFLNGLIFFGMLFASVVWHEIGHAIAVRSQKLGESIIVLHGLGGVTRYRASPSPRQGVIVAAAGPAAGLLLAALLYGIGLLAGSSLSLTALRALELAIFINVALNLANLLPVFPLDGGQILRFALSMRTATLRRALRITVVVGGVVLGAAAVALYLYSGFDELFVWLIMLFIAAENVRLWKHAE